MVTIKIVPLEALKYRAPFVPPKELLVVLDKILNEEIDFAFNGVVMPLAEPPTESAYRQQYKQFCVENPQYANIRFSFRRLEGKTGSLSMVLTPRTKE